MTPLSLMMKKWFKKYPLLKSRQVKFRPCQIQAEINSLICCKIKSLNHAKANLLSTPWSNSWLVQTIPCKNYAKIDPFIHTKVNSLFHAKVNSLFHSRGQLQDFRFSLRKLTSIQLYLLHMDGHIRVKI